MIYSHAHYDHIGGAARFHTWAEATYPAAPITVWGAASSRDLVATSKAPRAAPVTRLVTQTGAGIDLGADLGVYMTVIGGHKGDDLAIYIPAGADGAPGIVHHVDVVFPGWVAPFTLALTDSVGTFVNAHRALLRLDWSIFSGGHLTRLGTRGDVWTSLTYSTDLIEAARAGTAEAAASGAVGDAIGTCLSPAHPRLATRCTPLSMSSGGWRLTGASGRCSPSGGACWAASTLC